MKPQERPFGFCGYNAYAIILLPHTSEQRDSMPGYRDILLDKDPVEQVVWLTFAHPERLNQLTDLTSPEPYESPRNQYTRADDDLSSR